MREINTPVKIHRKRTIKIIYQKGNYRERRQPFGRERTRGIEQLFAREILYYLEENTFRGENSGREKRENMSEENLAKGQLFSRGNFRTIGNFCQRKYLL